MPRFGIALIVFSSVLFFSLLSLGSPELYHRDEIGWSKVSIEAFRRLAIEHNPGDSWWFQTNHNYGLKNPNVGKYLMGASLWLQGTHRQQDLAVTDDVLELQSARFASRLPSAILFALLAASTYYLVSLATNTTWLPLILFALLYLHPKMRYHALIAMVDIPAQGFSYLGLAVLTYSMAVRRSPLIALSAWMFIGLAIATKMNALVMLPVFGLCYLAYALYRRTITWQLVAEVITGLAIVASIFILTNPALLREPAVIQSLVGYGVVVAESVGNFPELTQVSPADKLRALYLFAFQNKLDVAGLFLFVLGVSYLLFTRRLAGWFLLISAIVTITFVQIWVPKAIYRYFLPAVFIIIVVQAAGVAGIISLLVRRSGKLPDIHLDEPAIDDRSAYPFTGVLIGCLCLAILTGWLVWPRPTYSADVYLQRALVYKAEENHWLTRTYLERAVRQDNFAQAKSRVKAYYQLAIEYRYAGKLEQAIKQFEVVVSLNPRNYYATLALGQLYYRARGDARSAWLMHNRAIQIDPRKPAAYLSLARISVEQGNLSLGCDLYRQVLAKNPDNHIAKTVVAGCP